MNVLLKVAQQLKFQTVINQMQILLQVCKTFFQVEIFLFIQTNFFSLFLLVNIYSLFFFYIGKTGETTAVTCSAGYSDGGTAKCGTNQKFNTLTCTVRSTFGSALSQRLTGTRLPKIPPISVLNKRRFGWSPVYFFLPTIVLFDTPHAAVGTKNCRSGWSFAW